MKMSSPKVAVRLKDADNDEIYTVFVTPDEAEYLESDVTFATKVLTEAKKQYDETCNSTEIDVANENEALQNVQEDDVPAFKWPHEAILLLTDEYKMRQKDFISKKVSQKKIWMLIAAKMKKHGYNVNGPQCLSKFSGLKRTYKSIQKHNQKSGNDIQTWPYLSLMDDLLTSKPHMPPIISSTGKKSGSQSDCSICSVDSIDKDEEQRPNDTCNFTEVELMDETDEASLQKMTGDDVAAFKWPHEAVLLLMNEYKIRQKDFTSGKISQKKIWILIAAEMTKHGYNVTGLQCLSKFSGLKRTYKSIQDYNQKSGNERRSWPYLSHMYHLLDSKSPSKSGVSSIEKKLGSQSDCGTSNVDSCLNKDEEPNSKKPRLSFSIEKLMEDLRNDRRIAEEAAERRHKENVEIRRKFLNIFEKMINILEKKFK